MVTILLWAIVGGLAGLIFGVTAGLPGRIIVFVVLLGAGSAAVPLIEHELRQKRAKNFPPLEKGRVNLPAGQAGVGSKTSDALMTPTNSPLVRGRNDEVLPPDEARQWLDDFLVKQQAK